MRINKFVCRSRSKCDWFSVFDSRCWLGCACVGVCVRVFELEWMWVCVSVSVLFKVCMFNCSAQQVSFDGLLATEKRKKPVDKKTRFSIKITEAPENKMSESSIVRFFQAKKYEIKYKTIIGSYFKGTKEM